MVDLKNVVDWLNLEIRPGDPLQWLALSSHVLGRVPELPYVIKLAPLRVRQGLLGKYGQKREGSA